MAKETKYSIRDLKAQFPNDEVCTEFIFDSLHSRKCSCGGEYRQLKGRRQFQCSKCRFQIAPTANTIFHKSPTPLTLWFHAIFVFSNAKSGISAKELERQLGVTYKCAWRMLNQIRKALRQSSDKLSGDVETDGAYLGGRRSGGKNNENLSEAVKAKTTVMAAVQRGGEMRAEATQDMTAWEVKKFLDKNVERENTLLMTDGSRSYQNSTEGYKRETVDHGRKVYARANIHVNSVERFWSHIKRSIKGTHKSISKKYVQSYLDAFVFHYNNRHNDRQRFSSLLGAVLQS